MNNSSSFNFFDEANITQTDGTVRNDRETYSVKMTVIVMLSIFSVVGVIGNAIAFYIFFRRRTTSTSVIFILALAGTDFITCLVTIPYTVVFELLHYKFVYDFACKFYMFLITFTVPFSAYIMVGIALDRYFCICHPFLYAFTIPRAKAVIFCMGIPALIYGVITAMTYGTYIYNEGYHANVSSSLNISGPVDEDTIRLAYQFMRENNRHSDYEIESISVVAGGEGDLANYSKSTNITVFKYITHYGICVTNQFIFSNDFLNIWKKVQALSFLLVYVSVAVLYILIYKSIFTRRANKARRKKNNLYPTTGNKLKRQQPEETQMTVITGADANSPKLMNNQTRKDAKCARKITLTARNDPTAFSKPDTRKITGGTGVPVSEIQEDERTNLLPGSGDAGTNEQNGAVNKAANSSRDDLEEKINSGGVYIGQDMSTDIPVIKEKPKVKEETDEDINAEKINSKEQTKDTDIDISNVTKTTPDSQPTQTENNEEENNTAPQCQDSVSPEEKPLLPQTLPPSCQQQSPPIPPTSLPIQPTLSSLNSSQTEIKSSKKHVQTDSQTNSIKRKRPSTVRDRNLMANIKTAFMLFIVTLVFIIAFLPALLMANGLIPLNLIVFYGYFVYNVANPFIYAFMNQTFREDLKKIMSVCRR